MEGNRIHQLKDLFEIANLPYSQDAKALDELKKTLFLMLKATGNDQRLEINGIYYTRNDIISILEGDFSEQETDLFNFFENYPGVASILHPSKIVAPIDYDAYASMQGETWEDLRFELNEDYFMPYLAETYKTVSKLDINRLYALITYNRLFMSPYHEEFYVKIMKAFLGRLSSIQPPEDINFIYTESYRRVVQSVSSFNNNFPWDQFNHLYDYIDHLSFEEACKFFERQMELVVYPRDNKHVKYKYEQYLSQYKGRSKPTTLEVLREYQKIENKGSKVSNHDMKRELFKLLKFIAVALPLFFLLISLLSQIKTSRPDPEVPEGIDDALRHLERVRKELENRPPPEPLKLPTFPSDSIYNDVQPLQEELQKGASPYGRPK